jgi:cytoskeletal protein CcmA (bactofilin family)
MIRLNGRESLAFGVQEASMWKNKRPEDERGTHASRKEEFPMTAFEERKPMEPRFEAKTNPTKEEVINIGKSVFIKGELTGDEDLTIEGRVEGKIELKDHNLVIGPNGKINAEINAKNVTIIGSVVGNITASDIIEIKTSGSVMGDIKAPRISVADGAHFKGSVDMQRSSERKTELSKVEPVKIGVDSAASLPKVQAK